MLPALLHRIRGEVIFADGDDARNDRDDLRDVLAKGRRRSWTANPVDDVLDCHHDSVGLCLEIWLRTKKVSDPQSYRQHNNATPLIRSTHHPVLPELSNHCPSPCSFAFRKSAGASYRLNCSMDRIVPSRS